MRPDIIKGCSAAIEYKDKIIIRSWADRSFVTCKLPEEVNPKQPKIISLIEWMKIN